MEAGGNENAHIEHACLHEIPSIQQVKCAQSVFSGLLSVFFGLHRVFQLLEEKAGSGPHSVELQLKGCGISKIFDFCPEKQRSGGAAKLSPTKTLQKFIKPPPFHSDYSILSPFGHPSLHPRRRRLPSPPLSTEPFLKGLLKAACTV